MDGVTTEFSTVEWETDSDAVECIGSGPWDHFALVRLGSVAAPVVARELRVVSELVRGRTEQHSVIAAFLRRDGCDVELVRRGMRAGGIAAQRQDEVHAARLRTLTANIPTIVSLGARTKSSSRR